MQTRKQFSRRKFLKWSAATTAGTVVLAACAPAAPPTATPAPKPAEPAKPVEAAKPTAQPTPAAQPAPAKSPVTIRYYQTMNSVEEPPIWQAGIDRFQQKYPDIKIAHEYAPWANYWEKLLASVAARNQADVVLMVTMYVQQYGQLGAIQDLGPFARADPTSRLDDAWPVLKVADTVNGKWPYELHFGLSTICVFYNKDMFKRAGVPDPNDKLPEYWTFDEFREAARKLTGTGPAGQQWGVTGRLSLFNAVAPLMESNGGGLINLENTKTLLDRPESIEMMEKVAELFYKDKLAPTAQEARDIPLFESGRTAMSVTSPERALWYRERIKDFEWDLAPLPVSSKTKVKRNWVQSGGLSMSSITTQPEAAWNFLNYYMSAENLVELMGKPSRGIPGRPSVKNSLLRPDQPPKHMHHFIDAVDFGTCSVFTNFDEFNKILGPASEAIYDGKRPVAEMFREIAPKIQALLPK